MWEDIEVKLVEHHWQKTTLILLYIHVLDDFAFLLTYINLAFLVTLLW
jgi:hypothetical protein